MKILEPVVRTLISMFLTIAVAVHLAGPFFPDKLPEPLWSHLLHTVCYSVCLFTFLRPLKFRLWLFVLAAIYPFAFHAKCFWVSFAQREQLNIICLLVIIVLPLAGWLIQKQNHSAR